MTAGGSACNGPPTTCRPTGRTRIVRSRSTSTSGYRTSTRRPNAPSNSAPACCAATSGGTHWPTRPAIRSTCASTPTIRDTVVAGVMLDCPDAKSLSHFYAQLLGKPVTYEADGVAMIGQDGAQPVMFQQVEQYTAPRWPDPAYPQQIHLDVTVQDVDEAERAALDIGATRLDGAGETGASTPIRPASRSVWSGRSNALVRRCIARVPGRRSGRWGCSIRASLVWAG